jgi:hypothetical protein
LLLKHCENLGSHIHQGVQTRISCKASAGLTKQIIYPAFAECGTILRMPNGGKADKLRLVPCRGAAKEDIGLLSSGVEIECSLRQIVHPEGRFQREDGTRYDVCVMEMISDPSLRPPSISRANFVGDRNDTSPDVIRLGNVRQTSFRLRLISPGAAFGTRSATGKPGSALT